MAPTAHWIRAAAAATSSPPGCAVETPPAISRGRFAATRRSAISITDSGGMPASRDTISAVVGGRTARISLGRRFFGAFRATTSRSRKERRSRSRPGATVNLRSAFPPVSDMWGSTWYQRKSPPALAEEIFRV